MTTYIEGRISGKPQILQTRSGKPYAKILLEEEVARERQQQGTPNTLLISLFGRAPERAKDLQTRRPANCCLPYARNALRDGVGRNPVRRPARG